MGLQGTSGGRKSEEAGVVRQPLIAFFKRKLPIFSQKPWIVSGSRPDRLVSEIEPSSLTVRLLWTLADEYWPARLEWLHHSTFITSMLPSGRADEASFSNMRGRIDFRTSASASLSHERKSLVTVFIMPYLFNQKDASTAKPNPSLPKNV